jgi:hypothetical protein
MTLAADIAQVAADTVIFHAITNGDASDTVTTDSGEVDTIARAISKIGNGNYRGAWVGPGTLYAVNDTVTESAVVQRCIVGHTSAALFATDAAKWVVQSAEPVNVTNAQMADMAQATIKGRDAGAGTGKPVDLTPAQARAAAGISAAIDPLVIAATLAAGRSVLSVARVFRVTGSTHAEIQDAVDAAFASGGGIVELEPDTYTITGALVFRAGVVLRGAGVERTILDVNAGGSIAWTEASLSDINGGGMSDLSARFDTVTTGISVSNVWGWFCYRCRIWGDGSLGTAIALKGFSFECDIRANRITDYDTAGISFADISGGGVFPNGTLIEHNDFAGNDGGTAIVLTGASTVKIVHNYFEHALGDEGAAVSLSSCNGAYIAGNWIGGNYGASNQITVGAGTVEARIVSNHISLTGGTGVSISGSGTGYISVIGNCFDVDNGVDVLVVDGRNAVNISGNIVKMIDSGAEGLTGSVLDIKNVASEISVSDLLINAEGAGNMAGTGIKIANGCFGISIFGGSIVNMTTGVNCLSASASKTVTMSGVRIAGNGTQASITALSAITIRDCPGFKTSGKGNGTITSGTTSVTVAHGLAITPPSNGVVAIPYGSSTNKPRHVYVGSTDATNVTINCDADPGASGLAVAWSYQPD